MAGNIDRPSIVNLHKLGNFTQAFRWYVNVTDLPQELSNYDSQMLNFHAESMSLPTKEVETTEIQIRGNMVRQQGVGTYSSPITLTLIETVDAYCLSFLSDWQELAWSTEDTKGRSKYKNDQTCSIILTLLDSMDKPYYEYKLFACQLANGEPGNDADASTADPFKPALSIAYDYFKRYKIGTASTDMMTVRGFGDIRGAITNESTSK